MILIIGGLDCSGAAGLSVDLKVCQANGVHALPIISTHTVQTIETGYAVESVQPHVFAQQLHTLLKDPLLLAELQAIKIGLFCDATLMHIFCDEMEHTQQLQSRAIPIVFDPVIQASSGLEFLQAAQKPLYIAALNRLLSYVSCITPNQAEWQQLHSWITQKLIEPQPNLYTLVSSQSIRNQQIRSELLSPKHFERIHAWQQPRIAATFRGTGCALTTAIACALSSTTNQSDGLVQAISIAFEQLQAWLQQSIENPIVVGQAQSPYLLRIEQTLECFLD